MCSGARPTLLGLRDAGDTWLMDQIVTVIYGHAFKQYFISQIILSLGFFFFFFFLVVLGFELGLTWPAQSN
jgi:hypothetical protein